MLAESISEESCINMFTHDDTELSEAFTKLWIQIINKKESEQNHINVANGNVSDL